MARWYAEQILMGLAAEVALPKLLLSIRAGVQAGKLTDCEGAALISQLEKAAKNGGSFIDPATVRFSQDSIKGTFKAGGSIEDLVIGLKNGTIKPGDIPPIRLVEKDGVLYSLDNRRLQAFQEAGIPIPYRMATPEEIAAEAFKFSTENGGTSIRVRGK